DFYNHTKNSSILYTAFGFTDPLWLLFSFLISIPCHFCWDISTCKSSGFMHLCSMLE
ncbi:unnamed protein product, partial [Musa hybrid cultivar]